MSIRDARTLKAIGELRASYPYAAAVLCYVAVERILKRYVLEHWDDPAMSGALVPPRKKMKKHGGKVLGQLQHLSRTQRLEEVLCKLALGDVEQLLDRPPKDCCAGDRNEAMHSNLFLKEESSLTRATQRRKNRERYRKAKVHLGRALTRLEGLTLSEVRSALSTRPNKRL